MGNLGQVKSIYLYSPISQNTNLPQGAVQSVQLCTALCTSIVSVLNVQHSTIKLGMINMLADKHFTYYDI